MKKLHVQLLGEDLCWQKRTASLATLSTVIACVFVNSAMGFSVAIGILFLCYKTGYVAPPSWPRAELLVLKAKVLHGIIINLSNASKRGSVSWQSPTQGLTWPNAAF